MLERRSAAFRRIFSCEQQFSVEFILRFYLVKKVRRRQVHSLLLLLLVCVFEVASLPSIFGSSLKRHSDCVFASGRLFC